MTTTSDRPARVVFLDRDTLSPETTLRELGFPHELEVFDRTTAEQVAGRISDADIVITNKAPVREAALAGAKRLRLVAVAATGTDVVQVMRDLSPEVDLVGPMPYAELQSMIDDPPGFRQYWSADYHDTFPDPALETFVAFGLDRPSPLSQQLLLPWGGAVARVAEDASHPTLSTVRHE